MGFHLRKSINLGGVRLNLSNSGIGFSTGVKGLRVGVDGKGRGFVGGGKGILRYRKYISSNNQVNTETTNNSDLSIFNFPFISFSNKFVRIINIILAIICTPIFLFYGVGCLFLDDMFIVGVIILGIYYFFLNTAFFSKALKFEKYIKQAMTAYNNENYEQAINNFILADKYKAKNQTWEQSIFIPEKIYSCYCKSNNYETALNYIKNTPMLTKKREKTVECYYKLDEWEQLINHIQTEYSNEEKNEHPLIIAMLAEAFLKLGKNGIALETMLSGPIKKRTMNLEMCAFRYQLGLCYEANNDKKNALKQYQKIYSYDINYEDVAERISNLEDKN